MKNYDNFLGNNAAPNIKKTRFWTHFFTGLDPVLEPELEPEQKLFQSWNRNRNKSLGFHNTESGGTCMGLMLWLNTRVQAT